MRKEISCDRDGEIEPIGDMETAHEKWKKDYEDKTSDYFSYVEELNSRSRYSNDEDYPSYGVISSCSRVGLDSKDAWAARDEWMYTYREPNITNVFFKCC